MDTQISTYPARVLYRATPAELLAAVRSDLGDGIEPFIFPAEISSNRLDAYYGHMGESTLRNFATDAQAGVSFQDSHSTARLGFGQSLTGTFEIADEIARVVADFYTIPGIEFGGMQSYRSTDDFIKAVKARLVRDVSVGFYGGDEKCDICGESVWDFMAMACPHIPGIEYAIGDSGKERITATFTVQDAHLAEVSAVYDGATPEAMILKAERAIQMGELPVGAARLLETRYRIKLPGRTVQPGVDIKTKDKTMSEAKEKPEGKEKESSLNTVREILAVAKAPEGSELEGVRWLYFQLLDKGSRIHWLEDELETTKANTNNGAETHAKIIADLNAEIQRLTPMADEGQEYRNELINDTVIEGIRALGDSFPEETYREMLKNVSTEGIRKMRDTFAGKASQRLPNGRQTVDDDQNTDHKPPEPVTPDLAYS